MVDDKSPKDAKEEEKCRMKEFPEKDDKKTEKMEEIEDTEESEEDKKKKKKGTKKGEAGGENPQEDTASSTDANSSISPNMGVPSTQNVFVPQSNARVGREASSGSSAGQSPSEVSYGKSVEPDLMKSPLFTGLSSQMTELQKAFEKKLEAMEKSFNDRVANINKSVAEIEKFYKQPFYKAINENVNPEAVEQKPFSKQIADGKVRYSN